jgi:hypothetical protein
MHSTRHNSVSKQVGARSFLFRARRLPTGYSGQGKSNQDLTNGCGSGFVPNISGIQNQLALWFIEKQRPDGTVTHALVYLGPHEIDGKDEGHPQYPRHEPIQI